MFKEKVIEIVRRFFVPAEPMRGIALQGDLFVLPPQLKLINNRTHQKLENNNDKQNRITRDYGGILQSRPRDGTLK